MSSEKKHITLFSSDGREFVVDEAVALQSVSIKNHVDQVGDRREIVVPDVTGPILEKVIEYCSKHAEEAKDSDEVKVWDAKFITVDQNVLFDLMLAANYLDIQGLLNLTCQTVKHMVEGKTPEEICKLLDIKPLWE